MTFDWFRWHHGTTSDPKFRVVARRSGQPLVAVLAVWAAMLECASAAEPRGVLAGWDDEDVAAGLDMNPEDVVAIREAMQGKTLDGDALAGWERRQPKREDGSAKRAKEWRERKKAQEKQDSADANAGERTRTQPNARLDKTRLDEKCCAGDAQAREDGDDDADGDCQAEPAGPHPAVQIIDALSAAVAKHWPGRGRLPHGTDFATAKKLHAAADTATVAAAIDAQCARMAAKGQDPPKTLSYFEGVIADAVKAETRPLPEGRRHDRRKTASERTQDQYAGADEAILRACFGDAGSSGGVDLRQRQRPAGDGDGSGVVDGDWRPVVDAPAGDA